MTWRLRERPHNVGAEMTAEYECPAHGRFEVTVERDTNGDPPMAIACPHEIECEIEGCQKTHALCPLRAEYRISAVVGRVARGSVVQGKSEARPSDHYVMNTEKLADGMPYDEWKAERAKVHRDESLRRVRKAFGRTGKTYVGGG